MPETTDLLPLNAVFEDLKSRYEHASAALVPALFEIQERKGFISAEDEVLVAEVLGMDVMTVHATITFYPLLFTKPLGKTHIQVCHNISCSLVGAEHIIDVLKRELGVSEKEVTPDGLISFQRAECLGCCCDAPVMLVGEKLFGYLTEEKIKEIIAKIRTGEELVNDTPLTTTDPLPDGVTSCNFLLKDSHHLKVAEEKGAYRATKKALLELTPDEILNQVKEAGVRGQGGAGFPAGMKWSFVPRDTPWVKYLCVNGDESEPGTCKDREIFRRDPHRLIDGIIMACKAIGVHTAYVYIRREFYEPRKVFEAAIKEAYQAGYLGKNILGSGFDLDIHVHHGAGAYICGEETGLIESLEGKKGWPRIKPPFPALKGLFGRPTVVNNVETLANIPYIINFGAGVFRKRGTEKSPGTKLYGVSGHVKRPGVWELPMGVSLRELIFSHAGGMREGHALKAVIPGGSSVPVLKADEIDVALDFESTRDAGTMLGSGGVIVMDDTVSMPEALEVISRFYAHESCGQCTPCREGTGWTYKILHRMNHGRGTKGDLEALLDLANNMDGTTICPLGSAAAWPIQAMLKKFPEEFEKLIVY
jgi:NADH-quinone oxidoreductase F subunit